MNISVKDKIKALMLYICEKIEPELSGVIKLNKIMWFSEIETMYQTGKPLTGSMYIRQKFGPVALNAPMMREELIKEGSLYVTQKDTLPDGSKRQIFSTSKHVELKNFFSEEQIKIIDEQIEKYKNTNAMDISEISHDSIWASLEDADEMPLDLYIIKPVYTEEQKSSVREFSRKCMEEEYGRASTVC